METQMFYEDIFKDSNDAASHFDEQFSVTENSGTGAPLLRPSSYAKQRDDTRRTYSLYASSVPSEIEERGIKRLFSRFGKVESCYFDRVKRFAFVEFISYTAAETALKQLNNKPPYCLFVAWKKSKKKTTEEKIREERREKEESIIGQQEQETNTPRTKAWLSMLKIAQHYGEAYIPQDFIRDPKRTNRDSISPSKTEERPANSPTSLSPVGTFTSPTAQLPPLGRSSKRLSSSPSNLPPRGRSRPLVSAFAAVVIGKDTSPPSTTQWNSNSEAPSKQEDLYTTDSFTALISHVSIPDIYIIPQPNMHRLLQLKSQLKLYCKASNEDSYTPSLHEVVAARFKEDQQWYRCRVEKCNRNDRTYEVFFIDFGNSQITKISDMKKIATECHVDTIAPVARKCRLYSETGAVLGEDCKDVLDELLYETVTVLVMDEDADAWLIRMGYLGKEINNDLLGTVASSD